MKGHPLQNFKSMYLVNSYRFAKEEVAIYFTINGDMAANSDNVNNGNTLRWEIEGVVYNQNNTPAHTFLNNGGIGKITSDDDLIGLEYINLANCNLVTANFEAFVYNDGTVFLFGGNTALNQFKAPIHQLGLNQLLLPSNAALSGIIDLSKTGGIRRFYLINNDSVTNIVFDNVYNFLFKITEYFIEQNDALLSLDFTGVPLAGAVRIRLNTSMTSLIFGLSTSPLTQLLMDNSSQLTSVDLSPLQNLSGTFQAFFSGNLQSIINPSNNNSFLNYRCQNCNLGYIDFTVLPNILGRNNSRIELQSNGMTTEEVNHILVDLAASVAGEGSGGDYTGRSINISGTNAAPDSISGGYDGLTAKSTLESKGITVTTS